MGASSSGTFTVASAWEQVRCKRNLSMVHSLVWSSVVPLKVSFFTWRLLHKWVPLDHALQRKVVVLASRYCCCGNAVETRNHLFVLGPVASAVWQYFDSLFGIRDRQVGNLLSWLPSSSLTARSCETMCVLLSLSWFCGSSGRLGIMHDLRVCLYRRATSSLKSAASWSRCVWVDSCNHSRSKAIRIVYRQRGSRGAARGFPDHGWSRAIGGGILRSVEGDLVFAFYKEFGDQDVLMAEALTLLEGLMLCRQGNHQTCQIEVDSRVLVSLVSSDAPSRWPLCNSIRQIKAMVAALDASIAHIFREANSVADALASSKLPSNAVLASEASLPPRARAALQLDRLQVPHVRFRRPR
nr:uncharacterized protein LOC113689393 [Coffea arabica]